MWAGVALGSSGPRGDTRATGTALWGAGVLSSVKGQLCRAASPGCSRPVPSVGCRAVPRAGTPVLGGGCRAGAGNSNPGERLCKKGGPGRAGPVLKFHALTEKPPGRIPDRGDSSPTGSDDFASPVNTPRFSGVPLLRPGRGVTGLP